jgi:hypothetical protein
MIPTRNLEELKNMPDDRVDFTGSFLEVRRLLNSKRKHNRTSTNNIRLDV